VNNSTDAPTSVAVPRHHRTLWWKEALIISAFYAVYTMIRNQFGSALVNGVDVPLHSFTNAVRVIRIERAFGLYHEESVQDFFLPHVWFIKLMNTYYGTAHFFVTMGVFILLFKRRPDVFAQWRNTLAAMTGLAIIGFVLFPLMPPRLLDEPCTVAHALNMSCAITTVHKTLASSTLLPSLVARGHSMKDRLRHFQINTLQCHRYTLVGQRGVYLHCGQSQNAVGLASHSFSTPLLPCYALWSLVITSG
jgi:hypothetical protein